MGMQTMSVQPSTQPTGKGGAVPQSQGGFDPFGPMSRVQTFAKQDMAPLGRSDQMFSTGEYKPPSPTRQMQSAMTGQPRFGQPNQYAQTMPWDQAQFGTPASGKGNAAPAQGKGQAPAAQGKGQTNQPFIAPTQFPVANQFNTQPAPVDQEEQKPQTPTYGGSEGYGAGY